MATAGEDQVWTWKKPPPLSKAALRNVFERTNNCTHLYMLLNIPFLKWSRIDSAVEYYLQSRDPRKSRNLIFQLDMMGETVLADTIMEYAEPSADPSLNPHLLIPVFTAISGPWEEIQVYEESEDVRATITEIGEEEMTKKPRPHTTVPFWRASRFLEKFSDRDKVRAEAAKYYALYHPDPSWSDLSLALTRAQETEAVERAIEIMTGTKAALNFKPPFEEDAKPTLIELLEFPTASGNIDVTAKVGMKYENLGTLLLKDTDGAVVPTIIFECQQKADKITVEILRRWLSGKGRQPVTWKTLTRCMRSSGLPELASLMEKSLYDIVDF